MAIEYALTSKEIDALIKKYSNFYGRTNRGRVSMQDIKSEVGFGVVKGLQGWEKVADKTAKVTTYLDRVIKNHMRDFLRTEAAYSYKMMFVPDTDSYFVDDTHTEQAGLDLLSAFSGRDYHIASEFIDPGKQVVAIIKAIQAKFKDHVGDLGDEERMLKAGVDCFAISLVYDVSIWPVMEIKKKIHEVLTGKRKNGK